MVEWCRTSLAPHAPGFEFQHHDVCHPQLNPGGVPGHLPFPVNDRQVTLFIAWSVFTHLLERDAEFYLSELGRVLSPHGVAVTTCFIFNKGDLPMMQEFQNALMINPDDPTNAVIFDLAWLRTGADAAGLVITRVVPPEIRGFHWRLDMQRRAPGRVLAEFPEDRAPRGLARRPLA